ncbi:uncharacterized protein PV09_05087 [Verruconis gallopava]|uniref:Uncharacterized protein n=1 Tax=Verruconis gallopava TaxID=253628 RepID=A0A0D2AX65_9PEZI|nr:uncharacterized protein PV09_05087 [Verruconis gallopava]KIW03784.1 hypothetical protein PV09_05087 [Verruconis gallopava]
MAKGFDELLDFLLDEVALHFGDGATLDDFKRCVTEFYDEPEGRKAAEEAQIDSRLLSTVDHELQERAWAWLLLHPDIWVGTPAGDDGSPPRILVSAEQDASVLSLVDAESADMTARDESERIRIWTSHERVWQTVAGHGVDFKRIPGEEFRLLCLIAAAREKGIAQPTLVKLSKQDKKSVPGRTDNLSKAGYIRKTKILAEKHNTSLLVHRRFLPPEELDAESRPVFVNGSLSFDNLLSVLKEKLKNGTEMRMEDFEAFVGCAARSWEKRALWRALERLDIIGVIQRYRKDELGKNKRGNMRNFKTKYIKLLREPNDADYKRYTSLTVKDREDFRRRLEAQDAETQGEHAEYMDDEDYAAYQPQANSTPQVGQEEAPIIHIMHWDSDVAWTNTVYNAVASAGGKGLSSMASRESTYGRFYDRPVEQMLARLTDVWQKAQPDHLRHFNIIRDTDTKGRSTNYLYRTHDAFQEAVDQGITVWENATGGKPYQKPVAQLDRFGFSKLDHSQFLKHGASTLAECIANAKLPYERLQRSDPILEKNDDGVYRVVWNHDQASKRRKEMDAIVTQDVDSSSLAPKKKRGRPRTKGVVNTESADGVAIIQNPPAAALQTPALTNSSEERLRIEAEEQAFHEAHKKQKIFPVTSANGKQIMTTWKPGKGRSKMILVDDVDSKGTVDLPKPAPGHRKPPVVVFESRVREILESLKAERNFNVDALDDQNRPATMKSPRLKHLSPSRSSDDGAGARREGNGDVPRSDGAPISPVAESDAPPVVQGPTHGQVPPIAKAVEVRADSQTPSIRRASSTLVRSPGKGPTSPSLRSPSTQYVARTSQTFETAESVENTENQPTEGAEKETRNETPRKDWAQRQSTYIRPPPPGGTVPNRRKKGTVVGRGTAQYKRIILIEKIIEKSGGIFPGDSEMVPAFQKLQKEELKSETISDRDTIMKAVKALVDDGKLMRFAFFFKDKNGKQVQKWILHQPHIGIDSDGIKELMAKIEEAHPRNFIPLPYGDGETGRGEQRKNIDRFQYRPGKSIIRPSGTEFVVDVEAKRKELETKRLAAAEAIRAEEQRRLKAQAARNRKRQAALAAKPRVSRAVLKRTAQPDPHVLEQMEEDDPDTVMQSVETDRTFATGNRQGRASFPDTQPAPASEFHFAARRLPNSFLSDAISPDALEAQSNKRVQRKAEHGPTSSQRGFEAIARAPPRTRQYYTNTKVPSRDGWVFKEPQGLQTYDPYYELQNTWTLLRPRQRFHPNTGTFSTDFFVRVDVHQANWVEPTRVTFEHHTTTDQNDIEWYNQVDDYDNSYHPERKVRRAGPGSLSRKAKDFANELAETDMDIDRFERYQLRMMKEEYPDLVHEPVEDGFARYSVGGFHEIAKEAYHYGIRPMEHVVLHGVDPEDFVGVQFDEHYRRPNFSSIVQDELDATTSAEEDEDEDDDDEYGDEAENQVQIRPQPSSKTRPKAAPRPPRTPRQAKSRRQSAAESAGPEEESSVSQPALKERRSIYQSGKCYMSSADSRRLFFACIAVRVLSGDLDGTVSWTTIQTIFAGHPNFDAPTFKARWGRMCHGFQDVIDRVQRQFQDAFLAAYEKGQLPKLDVMHGAKLYYKSPADWNRVIDWAVKTIPVFSEDVELPSTRDALNEAFEIKSAPSELQDIREKLEHIHTTHAKRDEITHRMSFATTLTLRKKHDANKDIDVAKSWIRANCATPDDGYDAEAANAKLKKLDQHMLTALTRQMHMEKVIAHSFKMRNKDAVRNYHLSDQYRQVIDRRPLDAKNFAEALAFKARLDKKFASSNPRFLLDYNSLSEGQVMAITEMMAAGRVSVKPVLPPVDSTIGAPWPRLTVWGFNEGQYKLRTMDRKIFVWQIEIVPTKDYISGLPLAAKLASIEPPRTGLVDGSGNEAIPLWYDIHGNLIPIYWEGMVRSVTQHIAMKAGSTLATLTAPYRGLVWEWEVKMLIDWLVEAGAAKYGEGSTVYAQEWWWTAVPTQTHGGDSEFENGAAEKDVAPPIATPAPKKRRVRGGKGKAAGRGDI